jgi:hypothetical protein
MAGSKFMIWRLGKSGDLRGRVFARVLKRGLKGEEIRKEDIDKR